MALELQHAVTQLVRDLIGGAEVQTPTWLIRPGRADCGRRWSLIQRIYRELTGLDLPPEMPRRERRQVDLVLAPRGRQPRIFEVDETQHFNRFRATTLRLYPRAIRVAFPKRSWIDRSEAKTRLEGGGFAKPRPPLFPGEAGRHRQRAFRDALTDIVPLEHGWEPTLRIAHFEVAEWIHGTDAKQRMRVLLRQRLQM
jgi:hypothetical protein